MPVNPNRLFLFWQELKRRKVVRVITVYAAAAFVILELVSIIVQPLRLPEWTLPLVIVLLCIGFVLAIILSWIYDVTPDGIQKTKSTVVEKESAPEKPSRIVAWKVATYFSVVVIVGLVIFHVISTGPRSGKTQELETSIAVLPFKYYNVDEQAEDLGDAFSNEIITQLYKVKGFDRIISHTSTLQYKGANKLSISEIGNELHVNYIIEGSLERQNQEVYINIQLIEAASDDHIWADEYREEWSEVFRIRSRIAKKVASELKTILTPSEIKQLDQWPTNSPKAYDLYLSGNQQRYQYTETSLLQAIKFYKEAITLDPDFALAYVGMSNAYSSLFWNANWYPEVAYGKGKEAALRALEIDNQLAEAHSALAGIQFSYDWDFTGAEQSYRKAIELNPNLVDAYAGYTALLETMRRYDECHQMARKALSLYPNSNERHCYFGYSYYLVQKLDSAVNYLKKRAQMYPNSLSAHYLLGCIYLDIGDYPNAISELEKAVEIDSVSQPYRLYLGIAYARAGMLDETRKHLEAFEAMETESRTVSFGRAVLLAELGQVDQAINWLQKAYEERYRHMLYLNTVRVMFEPIHSDPRYIEIFRKVWPDD